MKRYQIIAVHQTPNGALFYHSVYILYGYFIWKNFSYDKMQKFKSSFKMSFKATYFPLIKLKKNKLVSGLVIVCN